MPSSEASRANAEKARAARAKKVRARRIAKLKELTKEAETEKVAECGSESSGDEEIIISRKKKPKKPTKKPSVKKPVKKKPDPIEEDSDADYPYGDPDEHSDPEEDKDGWDGGKTVKKLMKELAYLKSQVAKPPPAREPVNVNIYHEKPKEVAPKQEKPIIKF